MHNQSTESDIDQVTGIRRQQGMLDWQPQHNPNIPVDKEVYKKKYRKGNKRTENNK